MKYGLIVTQDGKNAITSKDNEKVFSTEFSTLPIYKIFTQDFSLAGSAGSTTFNIRHELNFVPFGILYFKLQNNPDKWKMYPLGDNALVPITDDIQVIDFRMDKENIILILSNNSASTRFITIKIIIFAFPVTLSI